MKKRLLLVSFLLLSSVSFSGAAFTKVYICRSSTSYAYHKMICKFLDQCTHKIDSVTIEEAMAAGKKKSCNYCFRK